ncbi:hypothetical protein [Halorussus ruber]|uniref:hypothetical protein n=1 Tax=Halorussus ruber TaxID=1126238 RepID=UPI0010919EB4|nr:hypothetical protein [Halorussus ruber]
MGGSTVNRTETSPYWFDYLNNSVIATSETNPEINATRRRESAGATSQEKTVITTVIPIISRSSDRPIAARLFRSTLGIMSSYVMVENKRRGSTNDSHDLRG